MRFILLAAVSALAGCALAAPTRIETRSLVTEVGDLVSSVDDATGVTELEDKLDELLGGSLSKLEDKLGITFAEYILHLTKEGAEPGVIQAIGEAVAMLEDEVGITAIDEFLDEVTGGAITSLEDALGVTDIEEALGLEK